MNGGDRRLGGNHMKGCVYEVLAVLHPPVRKADDGESPVLLGPERVWARDEHSAVALAVARWVQAGSLDREQWKKQAALLELKVRSYGEAAKPASVPWLGFEYVPPQPDPNPWRAHWVYYPNTTTSGAANTWATTVTTTNGHSVLVC
jgi:hypothetical protein